MTNQLLPHIQYLTKAHDCVVLPGFGALIAHRVAASIVGNRFMPPSRTLAFNPAVSHNDGMLAMSLSRREGISYEAANLTVDSAIEELRNIYDLTGELTLPRIGRFVRDDSGAMQFEPADGATSIAAADYIGLPIVELQTAAEELPAEEETAEQPRTLRFAPLRHAGRVAASIAALIALGAVISTPIMLDRDTRQFASLATPEVSGTHTAEIPEGPQGILQIIVPDRNLSTATIEPETTTTGYRMNATDRYFLVVSSHANAAEARRYVAARPMETLAIVEGDGRFRVYAATGNTIAEVRRRMADNAFSALHPDGWVLKR
ncbi:MAG: hypothetical protein NC131_21770 [Roseburia sp.]|nr:hypothetical protein [Roseburia sp.]